MKITHDDLLAMLESRFVVDEAWRERLRLLCEAVVEFADDAVTAEREVCAKVAESHPYEAHMEVSSFEACAQHVVTEIASAIRARTGEGT